ncbi:hypothetical protein NC652_014451 [Populus alba x Populus x berolinensis]|uniref:Uncharacterized protein n=1 Tax=Populus alba x Populus x berolinensis TaxID=444605 RepID=A0AAD6QWX3_9ROSI|nr:hypothetical protein NC652_014451 [Populus alba x Populus x berolinensis]KAJ6998215.1 hypothetical protein NC653_014423 [Populus alba x Populus x berolinensis]
MPNIFIKNVMKYSFFYLVVRHFCFYNLPEHI